MQPDRRLTSLTFDKLDDRIVPAVLELNLTSVGAKLSAGAALVHQTDAQPTGTGHIHSFVRFQGAASGGGSEQGYNTTARPLQFDENRSPSFTRELTVGAVPRREVGGESYREFLLDINQKSSSSKLSLDQVQVFLAAQKNLTGYANGTLAGLPPVFDLDASVGGEGVTVMLDARLNSGSGSGDMLLFVPETAFVGATAETYVYLYTQMGGVAGATANGGFEEWAVKGDGGGTPLPPPAQELKSSLNGFAYIDDDRSSSYHPDFDTELPGVTIELRGVNHHGQTVTFVTTTAQDGSYTFGNLLAGTYTLIEHDSPDYSSEKDVNQVGTINGMEMGALGQDDKYDQILDIVLAAGVHGWNYNFGEWLGVGNGDD